MRILLVEDNADHRELMRLALTGHDATWQVEGVVSGEEALRHLAEGEAYDLVFLDYSLPRRDGLEVLAEIRRGEAPPPVVMVTGRGDEQVAVEAMKGGAYDYIVKGEAYLQRLPVVAQRAVEAHQLAVERKRAEALRESEENFRSLAENAFDGIAIAAGEGAHVYANEQLAQLTGYSVAELLKTTIKDLVHPDEFNKIMERYRKRLEGKPAPRQYETIIVRKDGRSVPIELAAAKTVWQGKPADMVFARDITERKRAEEALRENEARLRDLFDEAPVGYHELDFAGRIVRVNRTELALLGYTEEEMLGRPVWEFIIEREVSRRAVLAKLAGESLLPAFERTYVRRDGSRLPVLIEDRFLRDEQGRILGLRSTIQDISARKQAEEVALENQRVLEAVLETTRALVVLTDSDGRILLFNRACEELTGYSRQEVLGKPTAECFRDQAWASIALKLLMDRGAPGLLAPHECPWQTASGEQRLIEWRFRVFPSPRDGRPCVLGTGVDITARKLAEEALRESEARYKQLLGSVTDYVYTVQVEEGRPVRTVHGPGCAAVTGYTPEEYQADPYLWYRMVHDQDREAVTTQAARVMTGEMPPPLEHRLIHRDGSVRWVRNTPVPRYDERHRLVAYDGLIADITARKQGEEARLELERRLLHAQKLESLGVLAGGIAHDFNNLLMAILGNLDLARLVLSPVSAARLSVEEAVHAAQRAAELTRQMLAYAGKGRFIVTDLDLSALVAENAHAFRAALPKTVTLHLQLGQGLPPIHADAGQLQQVITNLFTNAAEALGDQAGVVALATGVQDCDAAALAGGRVATLPAPGRFVWLAVTDTGCGMDAATQQRLFEPFFTTKFTGRGLGLSAVLGIVQGHHGTLFVESEPGRGTTLRVLFPVSDAPPAPPAEGAAAAASQALAPEGQPPSSSGTILVVDDEPMVRTTLQAMVEHCGFRVLLAADGEEAVAIFRAHAAEIVGVLLDLSMPRMDGAATLAALRQIQPEVKVILCSGYDESEATQRFTGQGLAGFLQKPYTLGKLKALLAGLMPARGEGA